VDQCPTPNRAVSAPAAAFWIAAIVGTSSSVASRNLMIHEYADRCPAGQ
jgi:hypothetical protein